MKTFQVIKQELKAITSQIRQLKLERKAVYYTGERQYKSPHAWTTNISYATDLCRKKQIEFRELHIAYCLERGRTYEQIEPKVRYCNRLETGSNGSWNAIKKHRARIQEMISNEVKEKEMKDHASLEMCRDAVKGIEQMHEREMSVAS